MSVPQQLVIERIRARCNELQERYPSYRRDLVGYLAEILSLERASEPKVAKRVEDQLEAFGDLYHRKVTGEPDATSSDGEAEHAANATADPADPSDSTSTDQNGDPATAEAES